MNHDVLIVLFTFGILLFTGSLARYTKKLWASTRDLVESTEETTKLNERAHIFCGGLFGYRKEPFPAGEKAIHDAANYEGPWQIQIHNFGKTPGTITSIEWGVCPKTEYEPHKDVLVSDIIRRGLLDKWMKPTVDLQEVFAPMGDRTVAYRQVTCEERNVGDVVFGKITYQDVFGGRHWSCFALLHDAHHSTPIGRSFADDFDKPKDRRNTLGQ